jgi:hypothetical protein
MCSMSVGWSVAFGQDGNCVGKRCDAVLPRRSRFGIYQVDFDRVYLGIVCGTPPRRCMRGMPVAPSLVRGCELRHLPPACLHLASCLQHRLIFPRLVLLFVPPTQQTPATLAKRIPPAVPKYATTPSSNTQLSKATSHIAAR